MVPVGEVKKHKNEKKNHLNSLKVDEVLNKNK
jgi:hypothetical protein